MIWKYLEWNQFFEFSVNMWHVEEQKGVNSIPIENHKGTNAIHVV